MPAWIKDTIYRLLVEAVRVWIVSYWMEHKGLPAAAKFWIYSSGPHGIDWGNPPGPDDSSLQPLRRKRIEVTLRVVDESDGSAKGGGQ
jgi:hypothetical protein